MPTTYAIPNGRTVMDATLWSGDSTSPKSFTNTAGFKPDLVWSKVRNDIYGHMLFDSVRGAGANKELGSNSTGAEGYASSGQYGYLSAFNSNGFTATVGSAGSVPYAYWNQQGENYVAWQWQAGQGTTTTNNVGSISSQVSVNQTAGFSIVTYTGNGVASTVGHGLGVAPSMVVVKVRSTTNNWPVYHVSTGNGNYMLLNTTAASASDGGGFWNNTTPSSSVISLGSAGAVNASGATFVAYCWAQVAGFSQFGSYTGNGADDGTFVYTGFRPKFLLFKQSSASGEYWHIMDTTRSPYNGVALDLYPNLDNAEATYSPPALDLLSNGFKLRTSNGAWNGSGATYIYAAFAENPFKYANAR